MRSFSFDGTVYTVPEARIPPVPADPLVTIVLTAFKRARQLRRTLESIIDQNYPKLQMIIVEADDDGGLTREVAADFATEYYQRLNWADRRTAVTNNIGLRRAKGDVIILQCAEIEHSKGGHVVERMVAPIVADPSVSTFARVMDLNQEGKAVGWKHHPASHPNCFITFCQGFAREAIVRVGGYEETFATWGLEDNELNFRLQYSGIACRFTDALVLHQWHEPPPANEVAPMQSYYDERIAAIFSGRESFVANSGREWGDPRT